MAVGESRTELLQWLNTTLGLDYSKVEQCGTGAAYCQLMDSIYGGVPMAKVKFDSTLGEYDARTNMKILQAAFNRHQITKSIEVERLIKCRLQDNLELLQWFKRLWMENKDVNVEYDAVNRRKLGGKGPIGGSGGNSNSGPSSRRNTLTPSARGSRTSSGSVPVQQINVPKRRVASSGPNPDVARQLESVTLQLEQTKEELNEYRISTDSLETERNFYFNKLREIEILTQNIQDLYSKDDTTAKHVKQMSVLEVTSQIQEILYSTEKGFEVVAMDTESF